MTGQATNARRPWSIVLASREVWPFVEGGGLGRYMWAAARFLSSHAEVSILTSSRWQARYEEMVRDGDERLPEGVRFAFVDEPEGDLSPFLSWNHAWSVRLLEGVAQLYPDGGPGHPRDGRLPGRGLRRRARSAWPGSAAAAHRARHTPAHQRGDVRRPKRRPRRTSICRCSGGSSASRSGSRTPSSSQAGTLWSATPSSTEPARSAPRSGARCR